jgi:Protein of unknown function (DUF3465)
MLERSGMRAVLVVLVALAGAWYLRGQQAPGQMLGSSESANAVASGASDAARQAFEDQARGRVVVARNLADDRDGSPHQRFIITTDGGLSLLVAHNLDLAPRLQGLAPGDVVTVLGEYEWNEKGGLMHWTHDDPQGQHVAGYIEWRGKRYQ